MDKEWIDKKIGIMQDKIAEAKQEVIKQINASDIFTSLDKKYLIEKVRTSPFNIDVGEFKWIIYGINGLNHPDDYKFFINEEQIVYKDLAFGKLQDAIRHLNSLGRLMDSNWVYMEGDIVITDPCYTTDEWCDGFELESLPLCRDTIYGDWSCTTYDTNTHEEMGEFCADAGMVCVDTLENILKRKPKFLEEYGVWCRTIIKNFKGMIGFVVVCLDEESDNNNFNTWNYEVRVVGEGVNTETGKKINFFTTQTGL